MYQISYVHVLSTVCAALYLRRLDVEDRVAGAKRRDNFSGRRRKVRHQTGMAMTMASMVLPYRDAAGGWGCTRMVASPAGGVVGSSLFKKIPGPLRWNFF